MKGHIHKEKAWYFQADYGAIYAMRDYDVVRLRLSKDTHERAEAQAQDMPCHQMTTPVGHVAYVQPGSLQFM